MIPQTYAITYTPPLRPKMAPSQRRALEAARLRVKRKERTPTKRSLAMTATIFYMYGYHKPGDVVVRELCEKVEAVARTHTRNAIQEAEKRLGDESVARELNELRNKVAALQAQIAAAKTEAKSDAPEPAHDAPEQPEVLVQEA